MKYILAFVTATGQVIASVYYAA